MSYILFAVLLVSCSDHPYETDGHNNVQLPEGLNDRTDQDQDSLIKDPLIIKEPQQ